MGVALSKKAIDLGIVTGDPDSMLKFYRDTLGFEYVGDMQIPGGGTMHRLMCGDSMIKIVVPTVPPAATAPRGGIQGATGYRYWTMSVSNIEDCVKDCSDAGYKVVVPISQIRPGLSIAIVADPDGNWVEFLSQE